MAQVRCRGKDEVSKVLAALRIARVALPLFLYPEISHRVMIGLKRKCINSILIHFVPNTLILSILVEFGSSVVAHTRELIFRLLLKLILDGINQLLEWHMLVAFPFELVDATEFVVIDISQLMPSSFNVERCLEFSVGHEEAKQTIVLLFGVLHWFPLGFLRSSFDNNTIIINGNSLMHHTTPL
jgi:hypothetical protein